MNKIKFLSVCRPTEACEILIRKAKVKHKRQKLHEFKSKGEEGGKDWFSFLHGKGREEMKIEEL